MSFQCGCGCYCGSFVGSVGVSVGGSVLNSNLNVGSGTQNAEIKVEFDYQKAKDLFNASLAELPRLNLSEEESEEMSEAISRGLKATENKHHLLTIKSCFGVVVQYLGRLFEDVTIGMLVQQICTLISGS